MWTLDVHFCQAHTESSFTTDFYPTVKSALCHKSVDPEEELKGLGFHLGQGIYIAGDAKTD